MATTTATTAATCRTTCRTSSTPMAQRECECKCISRDVSPYNAVCQSDVCLDVGQSGAAAAALFQVMPMRSMAMLLVLLLRPIALAASLTPHHLPHHHYLPRSPSHSTMVVRSTPPAASLPSLLTLRACVLACVVGAAGSRPVARRPRVRRSLRRARVQEVPRSAAGHHHQALHQERLPQGDDAR